MDWSHEKSWIFQAKNVVKLIGVTKMNRHVGFHLSKRWKIGNQGETGNLAIQAYQWFWVESNPLHSTRVYGPGVVQNMGRSRYWSMSTLNMTWGLIYSSILSSKIQQAWVFSATQQGWRFKKIDVKFMPRSSHLAGACAASPLPEKMVVGTTEFTTPDMAPMKSFSGSSLARDSFEMFWTWKMKIKNFFAHRKVIELG